MEKIIGFLYYILVQSAQKGRMDGARAHPVPLPGRFDEKGKHIITK